MPLTTTPTTAIFPSMNATVALSSPIQTSTENQQSNEAPRRKSIIALAIGIPVSLLFAMALTTLFYIYRRKTKRMQCSEWACQDDHSQKGSSTTRPDSPAPSLPWPSFYETDITEGGRRELWSQTCISELEAEALKADLPCPDLFPVMERPTIRKVERSQRSSWATIRTAKSMKSLKRSKSTKTQKSTKGEEN